MVDGGCFFLNNLALSTNDSSTTSATYIVNQEPSKPDNEEDKVKKISIIGNLKQELDQPPQV